MTSLRCVCGAVVEGVEENLLEAVERHVREHHAPPLPVAPQLEEEQPGPRAPSGEPRVAAAGAASARGGT